MQTAEEDRHRITQKVDQKITEVKKDLENLSTANTAPSKTKLENTQDRQGELLQLIKNTQLTIIDALHNSNYCKSFHEFHHKLKETFSWGIVNEIEEQYHYKYVT